MKKIALISNGDFRQSASKVCWPKQEHTLKEVEKAFKTIGLDTFRANPFKKEQEHGFVNTQAETCGVFSGLDPDVPVVVVLSCWAYAHHVASSLKLHKGNILLLGNFDGTWPGLVALLNHSATLERMGIRHTRVWSGSFSDDQKFINNIKSWIKSGSIEYSSDHITSLSDLGPAKGEGQSGHKMGQEIAADILKKKRILGQMDPGCMGMLNAVISPDQLARIGMPVELLNQSDLLAEMSLVPDKTAEKNLNWLKDSGTIFHWGSDPDTDLIESQAIEQMKMYSAAGAIYNRYGLSAIGIPYQVGLVRCTSASDLPEGMLNNCDRPDIIDPESGEVIAKNLPIVHFNEGDLGSAVPQVLMRDILAKKNMPPETTLHDVRWGDQWEDRFVWVLEVSGGAPPAHWGGWAKTHVYRQPPMYFPKGGGTCSGVSKPGVVTWARFYESFGEIGMDVGTGVVIELPDKEVKRRLESTTKEWPVANVFIPGYERDELMSSHKSNHITICYGDILRELASASSGLGMNVNVIGDARKNLT